MPQIDFDMTRPEEMCRIASRAMRETGRAHADAKKAADDAKSRADTEPKFVAIAVRKREIDIGEKPTEQAVKDYVATCPLVEKAEKAEREAKHRERMAEVDWKVACSDAELLKGLLYHSGRRDG